MASVQAAGPFSGLVVIDLTHVLSGPLATTMLCDLGARVIKIEQPGHGDDTRTYGPFFRDQSLYFSFVNRGKESIVLNLKDDADRAILFNMVKHADILTENYRPGTMQRLGLSYDELSKINPRLVYASCSGFGQSGPLSSYPAYDTIIQAMSGIMAVTGDSDGHATRVGTSLSDLCGGVFMFCAITSALYAREKSGKGTYVDVAMFDATLAFMQYGVMEYVATRKSLNRTGNRHPFLAPFDLFSSADEDFVICAGNDHLFAQLCKAIKRTDLVTDDRFRSNQDRLKNHETLKHELELVLREQPAECWLTIIHEAGVPVAPLLNVAEAAELAQTKARNMLIEAGGVCMIGNPIKMSGYEDPQTRVGAPTLNQHGDKLRQEFAVTVGRSRT